LEASDASVVRQIKREAATKNYTLTALIDSIVMSTPFQMRMSAELAN